MLTIARAPRRNIGSGYRRVKWTEGPTQSVTRASFPGAGAGWRAPDPFLALQEELLGVVVEGEQLGVPGPADRDVQLLGGGIPELGLQTLQEEGLRDALIVVLLQRLVDPADGRVTQDAARDDLLAGRYAGVRERLSERGQDDVPGVNAREP